MCFSYILNLCCMRHFSLVYYSINTSYSYGFTCLSAPQYSTGPLVLRSFSTLTIIRALSARITPNGIFFIAGPTKASIAAALLFEPYHLWCKAEEIKIPVSIIGIYIPSYFILPFIGVLTIARLAPSTIYIAKQEIRKPSFSCMFYY